MEFSRPEYWSRYIFSLFPTQGLNPGLPHCRRILYQLSYQGNKTKRQPTDWEKVLANGVTDKTLSSVQFSHSVFWLCNPMNHRTPGRPVHHQLLESTQTHVRWVGDAIQTSHPLSSPSPLPSIFPSIRVFSNPKFTNSLWHLIASKQTFH